MIQNYPNIRKKSGYTENYYRIMENLKDIFTTIISKTKIKPTDSGLMETGYANISLWAKDDKQKYFIKISADDRLVAETFWYKKVCKNGINIPKSIVINCSKREIPFMYEILEFVEGIHINDKVPSKVQYRGAFSAGEELKKLHKISVNGFGTPNIDGKWTHRTWAATLKEFLDIRIKDKLTLEIFTQKEIDKIYDYSVRDRRINIKSPKLIHGDIGESNFIYTPRENKTTFLDPGSIIGGDPIFDIAYPSIFWSRRIFLSGIKKGYERKEKLTDEEKYRFERLRLVCMFFAAIKMYKTNGQYKPLVKFTKEILQSI